jgi:chemotaxis-related protein WspB
MLVVTFHVGENAYALRIDAILAVIPEVELRPVAQCAEWLRGVFPFRGELTPVVDLCRLIGGYDCPSRLSSRIALVRCSAEDGSQRTIGLLAERMTEARRLQQGLVTSTPMAALPYFSELVLEEGKPLQFVDPNAILGASGLLPGAAPSPRLGSR